MKKPLILLAVAILSITGLSACTTKADTVNHNLDKDAESFKIARKIQFVNGIINAGNLHLSYKLVEPEAKIRDAFEGVVNDITEQVGDTLGMVFDGVPAAPHRAQGSIVPF